MNWRNIPSQEISRRLAVLESENKKLRQEVGSENIGSAPACQVHVPLF